VMRKAFDKLNSTSRGIKKNNVSVVVEGNLLRVKGTDAGARGDYSNKVIDIK